MPSVGVGSTSNFPSVWTEYMADRIDAAKAADLLRGEEGSCCQTLSGMLINNDPHVRGLYNMLCIDSNSQAKQMQQQQQQMMDPGNYPAGTTFMETADDSV